MVALRKQAAMCVFAFVVCGVTPMQLNNIKNMSREELAKDRLKEEGVSKVCLMRRARARKTNELEKAEAGKGRGKGRVGKGFFGKVRGRDKRKAPPHKPADDVLAVLSYNTFLLKIKVFGIKVHVKSNINERATRTAKWFNSLNTDAVPDVVVLQEIFSREGQDLMRAICSKKWTRNSKFFGGHVHGPYIRCDKPGSKFKQATRVANAKHASRLRQSSGVVILVKKGRDDDIRITSTDEISFGSISGGYLRKLCKGDACLSDRGFWAVQMMKGSQKYWIFGIHAIAYMKYAETRVKQFKVLRKYIDDNIPDGDRVVIAGDMNIATGPYTDIDQGGLHVANPTEERDMFREYGSPGHPAIGGERVPRGFWLPLSIDMPKTSASPTYNHIVHSNQEEIKLGDQQYDWVVTPGPGDRLATPTKMRYQAVPVQSHTCFDSDQKGDSKAINGGNGYPRGTKSDDLSDHYGIFAEIRWTDSDEPAVATVKGHLGSTGSLPSPPTCSS